MAQIYELKLHELENLETPSLPSDVKVMRVAGGWIYLFYEKKQNHDLSWDWELITTQFVPFDNEFISDKTLTNKVRVV